MQVGPDWVVGESIQPDDYLVLGRVEAGEEGDRIYRSHVRRGGVLGILFRRGYRD
jgi:hypothetical protein